MFQGGFERFLGFFSGCFWDLFTVFFLGFERFLRCFQGVFCFVFILDEGISKGFAKFLGLRMVAF